MKTCQRYGEIKQIFAPESHSNAAYCDYQYNFFTPTVTYYRPEINMTPLKVKSDGLLLITLVNNNYAPDNYLNPEGFKQQ